MKPKLTDEELQNLIRLEEAATEGPWRAKDLENEPLREDSDGDEGIVSDAPAFTDFTQRVVVGTVYYDGLHLALRQNDADLIAAARNALPALLQELLELRAVADDRADYIAERQRLLAELSNLRELKTAIDAWDGNPGGGGIIRALARAL